MRPWQEMSFPTSLQLHGQLVFLGAILRVSHLGIHLTHLGGLTKLELHVSNYNNNSVTHVILSLIMKYVMKIVNDQHNDPMQFINT
jgi:hypothetical protein